MRAKLIVALVALGVFLAVGSGARLLAENVQGIVAVGSASAPNPVVTGGADSGNVARKWLMNASGHGAIMGGAAESASSSTTQPFVVAGKTVTTSGVAIFRMEETSKAALFSLGVNTVLDTVTPTGVKTSLASGASVTLLSAVASKVVYVLKLTAQNVSTTTLHTFQLKSSGGTVLEKVQLGAASATQHGGTLVLDSDSGAFQSVSGEGLVFSADASGADGDVVVTAQLVQK